MSVITEVAPPFPKEFLGQIDESNLGKIDEPFALVLMAAHDYNGALSDLSSQHRFLQIAKTHRVAIKVIGSSSLFSQKLQEAVAENGKPISLLWVSAHGSSNHMVLGANPTALFTESDLHEEDASLFAENATAVLQSCKTGQYLAQKIANVFKCAVLSPRELLDSNQIFIDVSENRAKILSCDKNKQADVCVFRPNAAVEPLLSSNEELKSAFSERIEHLKILATGNQPRAKWEIARMIYNWWEEVYGQRNDAEMLFYLNPPAEQGVPEAQFLYGCIYEEREVSKEKAFSWFWLSANQGFPQAQYQVGLYFQNGWGGIKYPSLRAARVWYKASADNGFPQAAEALARIGRAREEIVEEVDKIYKKRRIN